MNRSFLLNCIQNNKTNLYLIDASDLIYVEINKFVYL